MSDPIMIEPASSQRPTFAAWCLSQDPPIQTASASGWLVPIDLYPSVPAELLEGAYADGFPIDGAGGSTAALKAAETPVQASDGLPRREPLATLRDLSDEPPLTALDAIVPKSSTRRRTAAKTEASAGTS